MKAEWVHPQSTAQAAILNSLTTQSKVESPKRKSLLSCGLMLVAQEG